MSSRVARLRERLGYGAFAVITHPVSIRYLTGLAIWPGERFLALLVPPGAEPLLVVPSLEMERAGKSPFDKLPVGDSDDLAAVLGPKAPRGGEHLFVEKGHMTLDRLEMLERAWGTLRPEALDDVLEDLRLEKDEDEIAALAHAGDLIDAVVKRVPDMLVDGLSERDVARAIDDAIAEEGSSPSFPSIVCFGEHAAYPHWSPDGTRFRKGDLVLVDIGCQWDGYASDITRVFFTGEPKAKLAEVYRVVLAAHEAAAAALGPGVLASAIDDAARKVIADAGYKDFFPHRVGHGLGLQEHEAPSMHGANATPLRPGTIVTIEPGIYLPGTGGVRIEDDYLVTANGSRPLTGSPKDLSSVIVA